MWYCIISIYYHKNLKTLQLGLLAQMVERGADNAKAVSSILTQTVSSILTQTIYKFSFANL